MTNAIFFGALPIDVKFWILGEKYSGDLNLRYLLHDGVKKPIPVDRQEIEHQCGEE